MVASLCHRRCKVQIIKSKPDPVTMFDCFTLGTKSIEGGKEKSSRRRLLHPM